MAAAAGMRVFGHHRCTAEESLNLALPTSHVAAFVQPENIFVGDDGCLKIGDFGLSRTEAVVRAEDIDTDLPVGGSGGESPIRPDIVEDPGNKDTEAIVLHPEHPPASGIHTTGVGTASYASPEQLQGRRYGIRSDLFALGLVLLELCCAFTTTHERAGAFQSMREPTGAAPAHLKARTPEIAELAELLCRTMPEKRPSAVEVLERLDRLRGKCGCHGCPGSDGIGGQHAIGGGDIHQGMAGANETIDAGLREQLAAKTRKVEEQVRCSASGLHF